MEKRPVTDEKSAFLSYARKSKHGVYLRHPVYLPDFSQDDVAQVVDVLRADYRYDVVYSGNQMTAFNLFNARNGFPDVAQALVFESRLRFDERESQNRFSDFLVVHVYRVIQYYALFLHGAGAVVHRSHRDSSLSRQFPQRLARILLQVGLYLEIFLVKGHSIALLAIMRKLSGLRLFH